MFDRARQIKSSTTGVLFFLKCGQVKEPYMETLKSLILDQEHITAVKRVCYGLIYSVIIIAIYFMLNKSDTTLFSLLYFYCIYIVLYCSLKNLFLGVCNKVSSLKYTCIC